MMRGLWLDQRIGGHPVWRLCDERELMQVPDKLRKCVCFVRSERPVKPKVATAFFLAVPLGAQDQDAVYVVAARHCVRASDSAENGEFTSINLRLNTLDGGSRHFETDPSDWMCHPTADVAILPHAPDQSQFDYLYYPAHGGATTQFIDEHKVGPGEEVLITGLLVHHPGQTQILPIVRVGNIAAFPTDPILIGGQLERAVLVEMRSIGGLSGSPAFIHLPDWRRDEEGNLRVLRVGEEMQAGPNYLMGLVHGVYNSKRNDPDDIGTDEPLNTGISVVVPLEKILDLIDSPERQKEREMLKRRLESEDAPTPLVGESEPSEFERFEELTRSLVAVPKTELDEKRKEAESDSMSEA